MTYPADDAERALNTALLAAKLIGHHRLSSGEFKALRSSEGWDVGVATIWFEPRTGRVAAQVPRKNGPGHEQSVVSVADVLADERARKRLRHRDHVQRRAARAKRSLDQAQTRDRDRSDGFDRGL